MLKKWVEEFAKDSVHNPKGMHWRTWERLWDQALDAEMTRDLAMEATLDRLMRSG